MRFLGVATVVAVALLSCAHGPSLVNRTRPGGYAMGEKISLTFSLISAKDPPASIRVVVVEKKTGFVYEIPATLGRCDDSCYYECEWDGRKPDGRWPAGGRYLVFAIAGLKRPVYSDTVRIGLTD